MFVRECGGHNRFLSSSIAVISLSSVANNFFSVHLIERQADTITFISYSLYGGSMILLFLASTLYHAIPAGPARPWLKKFDHCAIYLLIAGTYTPFLLVALRTPLAYGLMAVIWGLALAGILFKLTIAHRFKALSLVTYLCMGWLSLIVVYQLAMILPPGCIWLLAAGGVIYSLGGVFYVARRIPFNHASHPARTDARWRG